MQELLEPYIGETTGALKPRQSREPRLPRSIFACPVGVRSEDQQASMMVKLFVKNDHVTYMSNRMFLKKVHIIYQV